MLRGRGRRVPGVLRDWPACPAYSAAFVRPDLAILISARPGTAQQESVFAISVAVVVGTILVIGLLPGFEDLLLNGWFAAWRDFTPPLGLVLIFAVAGVSHFTVANTFCSTVPRWGGLWQVPAPGARALSSEPFVARVRFSLFGRALALPR